MIANSAESEGLEDHVHVTEETKKWLIKDPVEYYHFFPAHEKKPGSKGVPVPQDSNVIFFHKNNL
jgi:hypothetical protein